LSIDELAEKIENHEMQVMFNWRNFSFEQQLQAGTGELVFMTEMHTV
jgi:hypothetical protein